MPNGHGFWRLSMLQEMVLREYTAYATVWDFGAGDLSLSHWLMEFGNTPPEKIYAVEKELDLVQQWEKVEGVKGWTTYFADIPPERIGLDSIGILSWPQNAPLHGLEKLLDRCDKIIYIGKCDDVTVCGTTQLWDYLMTRSVLSVTYDRNDMVVYGRPVTKPRQWLSGIEQECSMAHGTVYAFYNPKALAKLDLK